MNTSEAIRVIDSVNGSDNHMYFTSWDASHRSMVFLYSTTRNGGVGYKVLSESPPDAMQNISDAISSGLKAGMEKAGNADANFSKAALFNMQSLGKRSISVNMLRDALYRLSEMNFNGYLNQQSTDTLVRLAISQTALVATKESEVDIATAQVEAAKLDLAALEMRTVIADKITLISKSDSLSKKQKEDIINKLTH